MDDRPGRARHRHQLRHRHRLRLVARLAPGHLDRRHPPRLDLLLGDPLLLARAGARLRVRLDPALVPGERRLRPQHPARLHARVHRLGHPLRDAAGDHDHPGLRVRPAAGHQEHDGLDDGGGLRRHRPRQGPAHQPGLRLVRHAQRAAALGRRLRDVARLHRERLGGHRERLRLPRRRLHPADRRAEQRLPPDAGPVPDHHPDRGTSSSTSSTASSTRAPGWRTRRAP